MKIKELILQTNKLIEQKHFYQDVLGFTVHQDNDDTFTVQVGWTILRFKQSVENSLYHYCFLIPSNKLEEAMQWMESRVEIIETEEDGKIVFFETWNAHSFYFFDGAGNIAECIVRHDLQNSSDSPFNLSNLLCINEIGLGTDDINRTSKQLEASVKTTLWKGDTERFAANGSQEGLFLLPNYNIKQTWFPTEVVIKPNPMTVIVENAGNIYGFDYRNGQVVAFAEI